MAQKNHRPARLADVHELARAMPHVTVHPGTQDRPVYQVGGKSFVFFRNPRPDAFDPETGERYADVIVFWVPTDGDKLALVQDDSSPFFTTPHFDGHLSVLLRASRLGEVTYGELAEVVEDAWLSRASATRRTRWLEAHPQEAKDRDVRGASSTHCVSGGARRLVRQDQGLVQDGPDRNHG